MEKILVIGQSDNPGGVETVIKRYFNEVKDSIQFDFLVFAPICYDQEFYEQAGCNIFFVQNPQFRHPFRYKRELKRFFKSKVNDYSAIWVNCCDLANAGAILKQAKAIGINKRIIHAHNTQLMHTGKKRYFYNIMHNYWKKNIHKYATDFWTCSESAGKFFYTENILKSNKYKVINNAIELDKYKHNEDIRKKIRNEMHISEDCTVIGHIGRFQYQKNHEFLIDIFKKYHSINSDSKLLLIGQGNDENRIKKLVRNSNLQDDVIFMGARKNINELLQMMDVFLLPSRFEGLPLVLIEAQAAGLSCVTSKNVVTEAVNITGNVSFVDLKSDIDEWVDEINRQLDRKVDYKKCINDLSDFGFDIKKEGEKFKTFMLN